MPKNIRIQGTGLAGNLVRFRRKAGLTGTALAKETGLTAKTISNLETGANDYALEDTLLRITHFFGISLNQLLAKPWYRDRWKLGGAILLVALLMLVSLWAFLHQPTTGQPIVFIEQGRIRATDGESSRLLFDRRHRAAIEFGFSFQDSRGRNLLAYGLHARDHESGSFILVDLDKGRELWSRQPAPEELQTVFGDKAMNHPWRCRVAELLSFDGEDPQDIAVVYSNSQDSPSYVEIQSLEGAMLGRYHHFGYINAVFATDLDQNGRHEVLGLATNNLNDGLSLFLLDQEHCQGAAVDSVVLEMHPRLQERLDIQDGSLRRTLLPPFRDDIMDLLIWPRLDAFSAQVHRNGDGRYEIQVNLKDIAILEFDSDLQPMGTRSTDHFEKVWKHWRREGWISDEGSAQDYLDSWIQNARRFEAQD